MLHFVGWTRLLHPHHALKARRWAQKACPPYTLLLTTLLSALTITPSQAEPALNSRLATQSLLLDASQSGKLMVAVGERGHIIYSTDQGHYWRQAKVPTRITLTGVFMLDNQRGWAVGHDATILSSRDGGRSWQAQYQNTSLHAPLLDVWFADAKRGYAIGAYGLLLTTQDGGQIWQQQTVDTQQDLHLNHLLALADQLIISAEAGMIYRSHDKGISWQAQQTRFQSSWYGALATSPKQLWLYGLRGHLLHSPNGDNRWQTHNNKQQTSLYAALKTKKGDCIFAGQQGLLLINRHCDGQQWQSRQLPSRKTITQLLQGPDNQIIVFGEQGVLRLTL